MVPITKGDRVPEAEDLIISAESGDYNDVDLILCAQSSEPEVPTAMYQAQYLRYGNLVYQMDTPEALGAAIVAIEPNSTHDAAQLWREEETRRLAREKGTLVPENQTPAPDSTTPESPQEEPEENTPVQEDTEDPEPTVEESAPSEEEIGTPGYEPGEIPDAEVPEVEPTPEPPEETSPEPETPPVADPITTTPE